MRSTSCLASSSLIFGKKHCSNSSLLSFPSSFTSRILKVWSKSYFSSFVEIWSTQNFSRVYWTLVCASYRLVAYPELLQAANHLLDGWLLILRLFGYILGPFMLKRLLAIVPFVWDRWVTYLDHTRASSSINPLPEHSPTPTLHHPGSIFLPIRSGGSRYRYHHRKEENQTKACIK